MFHSKFSTLVAGYLAGSALSTFFSKTSKRQKPDTFEDGVSQFVDDFIDTQRTIFQFFKSAVEDPHTQECAKDMARGAREGVAEFSTKAQALYENYKSDPNGTVEELKEGMKTLYSEQKGRIDALLQSAPEKAEQAKQTLLAEYRKWQHKK